MKIEFSFVVSRRKNSSSFKESNDKSRTCWCHSCCLFCRYFGVFNRRGKIFKMAALFVILLLWFSYNFLPITFWYVIWFNYLNFFPIMWWNFENNFYLQNCYVNFYNLIFFLLFGGKGVISVSLFMLWSDNCVFS